jgi:predicted glycoside hydrolase/deacetylase ChbG (UPF0249 family)
MEILLCVTADDLGYSVERDQGIVECSVKNGGLVCRASLLVNGASAMSGYKLARDNDLPVGLHLNISEGSPCSPLSQVSTLVNKDGFFHGKTKYWSEDEKGFTVNLDEVKVEVEAQISRFLEISNGHLPNHWDGHQHLHVRGDIGLAIHSVFSKLMLFRTRMPLYFTDASNYNISNPLLLPLNNEGKVDSARENFYKRISSETSTLRKKLSEGNAPQDQTYCDDLIDASKTFMGYSTMGKDCTEERIISALRECLRVLQLKTSRTDGKENAGANLDLIDIEWMVHPGYKSPISATGCGEGADEFAKSEDREVELKNLSQGSVSEHIKGFLKSKNIVLCS